MSGGSFRDRDEARLANADRTGCGDVDPLRDRIGPLFPVPVRTQAESVDEATTDAREETTDGAE